MAQHKCKILFIFWIALYSLIFTDCSNTQTNENIPQATISLEKIIDKETQQPIENNIITLKLETPEGEIINTKQYQDQVRLSKVMLADGSVRLFIKVEAPVYIPWENALRMK
jgi:hypothetical protein